MRTRNVAALGGMLALLLFSGIAAATGGWWEYRRHGGAPGSGIVYAKYWCTHAGCEFRGYIVGIDPDL